MNKKKRKEKYASLKWGEMLIQIMANEASRSHPRCYWNHKYRNSKAALFKDPVKTDIYIYISILKFIK